MLHVPVDVRSTSLGVLAVLASVYMLQWASAVFIPLLLGLMLSYALSPIVNHLQRWRIPRALGAAVLPWIIDGGAPHFSLHRRRPRMLTVPVSCP